MTSCITSAFVLFCLLPFHPCHQESFQSSPLAHIDHPPSHHSPRVLTQNPHHPPTFPLCVNKADRVVVPSSSSFKILLYFCAFFTLLLACFAIKNLCIFDISVLDELFCVWCVCPWICPVCLPLWVPLIKCFYEVPKHVILSEQDDRLQSCFRVCAELLEALLLLRTSYLGGRWCLRSKGFVFFSAGLDEPLKVFAIVQESQTFVDRGARIVSKYLEQQRSQ